MEHKTPAVPSDEIDLRELVQALWASKLLIVIVTLVITCIAAAYAFLSTPVYETEVQTLPPTAGSLANYNMGSRYAQSAINGADSNNAPPVRELSTKDVYNAFLQRLTSDTVRQQFFEDIYLPAKTTDDDASSIQSLWKRLGKELTITVPTKPNDSVATVSLEGTNPKTIAKWTNSYVDLAIAATRKELLEDLTSAVQSSGTNIENRISALRKIALVNRQDRSTRLKSALIVAESIGLEVPPPGSPLISVSNASTNDIDAFANGSMMYLRGTKALSAELKELSTRTNDDAYIAELPDLLKNQLLLKTIDLNPAHLSVAIVDRAAIAPEEPIKPNKSLFLALGVILGGILGIFIALMRKLFQ